MGEQRVAIGFLVACNNVCSKHSSRRVYLGRRCKNDDVVPFKIWRSGNLAYLTLELDFDRKKYRIIIDYGMVNKICVFVVTSLDIAYFETL